MQINVFAFVRDLEEEENDFIYGEKTAYAECLEIIQTWSNAKSFGLDYGIEEKSFPCKCILFVIAVSLYNSSYVKGFILLFVLRIRRK